MRAKYSMIAAIAANLLLALMPGFGFAQSRDNARDPNLLRQDNITSTGATVPIPGGSKSAGQTSLDTDIERHNDHIDKSICSNC